MAFTSDLRRSEYYPEYFVRPLQLLPALWTHNVFTWDGSSYALNNADEHKSVKLGPP